ncbi:hypothetical protein BH20ACT8_BH20ACT8_21690 [soil metagenome]
MSSVTDRLDALDPHLTATALALARVAAGLAMLLLPAVSWRVLAGRSPGAETRAAVRIAGGRDLALGIGALTAADDVELARWVRAGALADAGDGIAQLSARESGGLARLRSLCISGAAAVVGFAAALRPTAFMAIAARWPQLRL